MRCMQLAAALLVVGCGAGVMSGGDDEPDPAPVSEDPPPRPAARDAARTEPLPPDAGAPADTGAADRVAPDAAPTSDARPSADLATDPAPDVTITPTVDVFDLRRLHEIDIVIAAADVPRLERQGDFRTNTARFPGTFTFDGVTLKNVGIRQKGGGL